MSSDKRSSKRWEELELTPSPTEPLDITIIGSGMIVHDQILPSLYHLQRIGQLGRIQIVTASSTRLRDLRSKRFAQAFPGQSFQPHPNPSADPADRQSDRYRSIITQMPPQQIVFIATPDPLHFDMARFALEHEQHVICVKPLVQTISDAATLQALAWQRGLFLGVEYHKRFDRRALEARQYYREGRFGRFRVGYATMIEPYHYRHSNFQNWFIKSSSDPFTYVGCHYVDQVYFITGLRPVEVAVRGVDGQFANGNEAYLWSSAQVVFEDGGVLSVINGLGYPDDAAGTNDQCLTLFCEGDERGAIIRHNDQFRGVSHGYTDCCAGSYFRFINPDYFRLVPWTGEGLRPVGYGYDSIEANVLAASDVARSGPATQRRKLLRQIDQRGLIATATNSSINEAVVEAGRLSITHDGKTVRISYDDPPTLELV